MTNFYLKTMNEKVRVIGHPWKFQKLIVWQQMKFLGNSDSLLSAKIYCSKDRYKQQQTSYSGFDKLVLFNLPKYSMTDFVFPKLVIQG